MNSGGILRQRWWPGLPVWLEVCLRMPAALLGRLLVLLQFGVCRALGRLLLCMMLAVPLIAMVARRRWRTPLLGRRGRAGQIDRSALHRSWSAGRSVSQALRGMPRAMGSFERRVIRPAHQFMLCAMFVFVLPALASRNRWHVALFGRRRRRPRT